MALIRPAQGPVFLGFVLIRSPIRYRCDCTKRSGATATGRLRGRMWDPPGLQWRDRFYQQVSRGRVEISDDMGTGGGRIVAGSVIFSVAEGGVGVWPPRSHGRTGWRRQRMPGAWGGGEKGAKSGNQHCGTKPTVGGVGTTVAQQIAANGSK
jgi:hypothetical protein